MKPRLYVEWRPNALVWGLGLLTLVVVLIPGCIGRETTAEIPPPPPPHQTKEKARAMSPATNTTGNPSPTLETATFGSGCFWCTEAVFQLIQGVHSVKSGYSGGTMKNPSYELICRGNSGHAEVIQVEFDPQVVEYKDLLEAFWKTHDPTTLNRQGNDVGTQYRSVVFYHSEEQQRLAEEYKQKLAAAGVYDRPIVTEITPAATFYPAEDYHQNFYKNNPAQPYCAAIVGPKVSKFKKVFADRLKEE